MGSAPVIANNIIKKNKTDGYGAGIAIRYFNPTTPPEFPRITGNAIVENSSVNEVGDGGGIGIYFSSPEIDHNVIARNEATRNGGGIACWRNSLPTIKNNYILANSASVPLSEGTMRQRRISQAMVGGVFSPLRPILMGLSMWVSLPHRSSSTMCCRPMGLLKGAASVLSIRS